MDLLDSGLRYLGQSHVQAHTSPLADRYPGLAPQARLKAASQAIQLASPHNQKADHQIDYLLQSHQTGADYAPAAWRNYLHTYARALHRRLLLYATQP